MHKGFLITAALFGALSVMLGAFAAHGLNEIVSSDVFAIFETGVRYQFYHVFALLAVGILHKEFAGNLLKWTGRLFVAGIVLFSGSLYLLTFFKAEISTNYRWIFFITPTGGLCFIAGWLLLAASLIKSKL